MGASACSVQWVKDNESEPSAYFYYTYYTYLRLKMYSISIPYLL